MPPELETTPTTNNESDLDLSDILELAGGEGEATGTEEPPAPAAPAASPAPVPPAQGTPSPVPAAQPPAQTQAAVAQVPAAQPPPAAPAGTVPQQPEPAQDINAVRQKAIDEMASSFALAPEQKEAMMLTDEGAKALQTLAAQSTLRAYENVMASVITLIPDMVRNIVASQQANERVWGDFFSANKHLEAHRGQVFEIAANYRKMNPQTPMDQLMKEIAALAVVRLGLAPSQAEVPVQTARPQPPPAPARAMPPRPPAAPAGVSAPPPMAGEGVPEYLTDILGLE